MNGVIQIDEGLIYPLIGFSFVFVVTLMAWIVKTLFETNRLIAQHDLRLQNVEKDVEEMRT